MLAVIGWGLLSFVIFLFSAQFLQDQVDGKAKAALNQPGSPIVSPTNVLILGSDLRAKGTKEPGAATSGPSRSDSIQLMRVGGGHGSKLSIPRDTVVDQHDCASSGDGFVCGKQIAQRRICRVERSTGEAHAMRKLG